MKNHNCLRVGGTSHHLSDEAEGERQLAPCPRISVFEAFYDALEVEAAIVGLGVSCGIRKALVGEGLSHIVEGALTSFCAYKFSILLSGLGVILISDCLSERCEETFSIQV